MNPVSREFLADTYFIIHSIPILNTVDVIIFLIINIIKIMRIYLLLPIDISQQCL